METEKAPAVHKTFELHVREQAKLEEMYAEIYADPVYREEQLALEAIFAPALMDGLEEEQ